MKIYGEYLTSLKKALSEIDENWQNYSGLIIAGTHDPKNHDPEQLIKEITKARVFGEPILLICYGHQLGAIEYARNILKIEDATSEEFGEGTFVVKKRTELKVGLHQGESYWNNYEVVIKTKYPDNFITVQYHPEYESSKKNPHPLLVKFLKLCRNFVVG